MGLRFRKSFKVAPGVKFNVNKKSVGVTVGTKGAHYTVNSKGTKTKSVGIPGTGISYVETENMGTQKNEAHSSNSNRKEKSKPSRVIGCSVELLVFFFLIYILVSVFFGGNDSDNADDSSTPAAVQENSADGSDDTDQIQTTTMYATAELNVREGAGTDYNTVGQLNLGDSVKVYSTENGWSKIDYNGVECFVSANYLSSTMPDTSSSTASADSSVPPTSTPDQTQTVVGETVYWTPNGEVYHSTPDCPSLSRSNTVLSGSIEESGKSRPCENCY